MDNVDIIYMAIGLIASHLLAGYFGYLIMKRKADKWDYQFKRYGTSHFNWKEEEYRPPGTCNIDTPKQ